MTTAAASTPGGINPNPRTNFQQIQNWQRLATFLASSSTSSLDSNGSLVSNVSLTLEVPANLTIHGSPAGASGTLIIGNATQNANTVFAGGATASGLTPTFRPLVAADISDFGTLVIAAQAVPIQLSTATPANIGSLTLSPGIWDITGVVDYQLGQASATAFKSGVSQVSGTFGPQDSFVNMPLITSTLTDVFSHVLPIVNLDTRTMSANTTVYLVAVAGFGAGTISAYGTVRALRLG